MNKEFSFNGNAGCGSGAPALNIFEMFNCNRDQAALALAREDWQPHERIPVLIDGKEIYLRPNEIIDLV